MQADTVITSLRESIGTDAVLDREQAGARYQVDFSGEHPCAPRAVVRPATTQALSAVMRICSDAGQPVVVQGGLTGLAGGATPQPDEIAVSLERMNGIEEIDSASMTISVLAGTPLQVVQHAAAEAGFVFPLDLGARGSCTIGGNVATNAGGNQVIRFGMMRNLVLGLEVVLADGTVLSSMNRMLKNNAGYDLKQLFIGTEGTLGIVTRAVLRLWPRLPSRVTALVALRDFQCTVAVLQLMQRRLSGSLSAFEVMWASYYDFVLEHVDALRSPFQHHYPIYALIEAEAADEQSNRAQLESALETAFDDRLIEDAVLAQSVREARTFWEIRDGIGEVNRHLRPNCSFDVSMPISRMPAFLAQVERELAAAFADVRSLVFGHLGDGNLHLVMTTGRQQDLVTLSDIVLRVTGDHAGSVAAEHGVGTLRRDYLHLSRSNSEIELMRRLKATLDPKGILNAGRVLPAAADRR